LGKGQELYSRAKVRIPGGTQLLSKRPEMFLPELWPAYYQKASGSHVWDMDSNEYVDMSYMGIGANVLGYCDPDVDEAVLRAVKLGNMCTLNCYEEVALAERMCSIHPWAEMVRYAKTGGEAMSIAVRIARAATNRDIVLFSGYHGWHDWYLSANLSGPDSLAGAHLAGLEPLGVPKTLSGSAHTFPYNCYDEFEALLIRFPGQIAAVVMEPIRSDYPEPDFLNRIHKKTSEQDIVLIFDEISSGMRLCLGGAHLHLGTTPDIAVFSKGISNGYPQGIIIGKRNVMEAAQGSFISSTYWTERIGLAATLATIDKYESKSVHIHLSDLGKTVQEGWSSLSKKHKLDIHVGGIYPLSHFEIKSDEALATKTYFTQQMLEQGFLASTAFYASFAHTEEDVSRYLSACDSVFKELSEIINTGTSVKDRLKGPVCHSGFQRLTR